MKLVRKNEKEIPNFSRYTISKGGIIRNKYSRKKIRIINNLMVYLTSDSGKRTSRSVTKLKSALWSS